MNTTYSLIDSGLGRKLEQFGPYLLIRPCSQAVWKPQLPATDWEKAHAEFSREPENRWHYKTQLPEQWTIEIDGIKFKIAPTDFGHLGIFPEQRSHWSWIQTYIKEAKQHHPNPPQVLNLFAYSGGSTLAPALAGAEVCHLDASKGMVTWARENSLLNQLETAPIRWIVDDVNKFLKREIRRNHRYEAIILDPPTFGRGNKGEVFKIEEALPELLNDCRTLLSEQPLFVLLSCHTPGFSPIVLRHMMNQAFGDLQGYIKEGEMLLEGSSGILPIPSGTFALWSKTNR